jgi:hypothetical protein
MMVTLRVSTLDVETAVRQIVTGLENDGAHGELVHALILRSVTNVRAHREPRGV